MDGFDFSSPTPSSPAGELNFDSPTPPSYQDNSFDSFGTEPVSPAPVDFGSFENSPAPQTDSFGDFASPQQPMSFDSPITPTEPTPNDTLSPTDSFGSFEQPSQPVTSAPLSFDEPSPIATEDPINETVTEPIIEAVEQPTPVPQETPSSASSSFDSMRAVMPSSGASDVLREYEEQHNLFLEEKAAEERKKHQAAIDTAKAELDKFYAERKQKIASTQSENRARETASELPPPANDKDAWTNVSKLVEWEGSHSDTTDRMRNILMDLKHAA